MSAGQVIVGVVLIAAMVVAAVEPQLPTVTVTLYVPEAAAVALVIDGFCVAELNPLGPVQLYVAPDIVGALRFNVCPAQIGPLLPAVGALGIALTVIVALPEDVPPVQLESETAVTAYVVVEAGLTLRVAGLVATLFWVMLSDHVTVQGPVP